MSSKAGGATLLLFYERPRFLTPYLREYLFSLQMILSFVKFRRFDLVDALLRVIGA